jgi:hypothetical protein
MKATFSMNNVRSSLPALSTMLLMAFAVPSYADVIPGEFATIGFWHNANGQAVIKSFGCTSSTGTSSAGMTLGQWLHCNFCNLFPGCASETNPQVAANFQTAHSLVGLQGNTYAKAFSVPLGCCASTIGLCFNSTAAQCGFIATVDSGKETYNVGNNGAAFGVPNYTTLTVFDVMQIANANYNPVTGLFYGGDPTLTDDLNNVLDGIDQQGDIR